MKFTLFAVIIIIVSVSCKKDAVLTVVSPKAYLPAYPGSIWYYSNGDVSKVYTEYVAHSYATGINSAENTGQKLVPYIDHEYLYEYEITQNSNTFPLKKLLSESTSDKAWLVDSTGTDFVYRVNGNRLNSFIVEFSADEKFKDSTYYDVLVVVEYLGSLDANQWNRKEYYAKNIGLIQVEINNPFDTLLPVIQKRLVEYKINK